MKKEQIIDEIGMMKTILEQENVQLVVMGKKCPEKTLYICRDKQLLTKVKFLYSREEISKKITHKLYKIAVLVATLYDDEDTSKHYFEIKGQELHKHKDDGFNLKFSKTIEKLLETRCFSDIII